MTTKFHRTAITRSNYSTPVQYLLKEGLLEKNKSILDYGAGRGFDVEQLRREGFNTFGFDTHGDYADYTNLDFYYQIIISVFVLNVIEDPDERLAVEKDIIEHLEPNAVAYLAVRGDKYDEGTTSIGTWQGHVEPTLPGWELVVENSQFRMWKYEIVLVTPNNMEM